MSKWLPESEWITKLSTLPDSEKISALNSALSDCPASVQLHLMLAAAQTDESERQQVLKRALASLAAFDLKQGHLLWIELDDEEAAASRATSIPYEQVDQLASAFPRLTFSKVPPFPVDFDEFKAACAAFAPQQRLGLLRFRLESELSYSTSTWLRYLCFLEKEMPVNQILIDVASRFTRARPDRKESQLALMDALSVAGRFAEICQLKMTAPSESAFLSKLAALDKTGADEETLRAFAKEAIESAVVERKFIKLVASFLLKRGDLATFRSIWKHSLLKKHAKEAPLWLEYIRLETVINAADSPAVISSAFKQALNAAAEAKDRKLLLFEWLNYARLYGHDSLLEIKARLAAQVEAGVEADSEDAMPVSKKPRHDSSKGSHTFNPAATLFINNLPYTFSQADLEAFFAPIQPVSLRLHMNGSAFKGHATAEFDSPATAASVLLSHNRRIVAERPVFLAPYQSPAATAALPSALSTKDPKTLFVSNLAPSTSMETLLSIFSGCHGFREVRHAAGKSFAYVEFEAAADAETAMKLEPVVDGQRWRLAISEPPIRRKADEKEKQVMLSMKPRSLR